MERPRSKGSTSARARREAGGQAPQTWLPPLSISSSSAPSQTKHLCDHCGWLGLQPSGLPCQTHRQLWCPHTFHRWFSRKRHQNGTLLCDTLVCSEPRRLAIWSPRCFESRRFQQYLGLGCQCYRWDPWGWAIHNTLCWWNPARYYYLGWEVLRVGLCHSLEWKMGHWWWSLCKYTHGNGLLQFHGLVRRQHGKLRWSWAWLCCGRCRAFTGQFARILATRCKGTGAEVEEYLSTISIFNADYSTSSDRYLISSFLMLHWYTNYIRLLFYTLVFIMKSISNHIVVSHHLLGSCFIDFGMILIDLGFFGRPRWHLKATFLSPWCSTLENLNQLDEEELFVACRSFKAELDDVADEVIRRRSREIIVQHNYHEVGFEKWKRTKTTQNDWIVTLESKIWNFEISRCLWLHKYVHTVSYPSPEINAKCARWYLLGFVHVWDLDLEFVAIFWRGSVICTLKSGVTILVFEGLGLFWHHESLCEC